MPLPLPIIDGFELGAPHRSLLMPGAIVRDSHARSRRLPRFFFGVESWALALETHLTPHFALWEFMDVDLYEPAPLRQFPRYVPCAVTALAAHLEVLRTQVGLPVHIAANGGYRSPSHGRSQPGERYSSLAADLLPAIRPRPYGPGPGCVDDHLHLDLGYVTAVPTDAPDEELE